MHNVHLSQEQRSEMEEKGNGKKPSPMQKVSRQEVNDHTRPATEAQPPAVDPFPPGLISTLWLGIAAGALLGLLFGNLLFQGILPIAGWEMLFSMTPVTFHAFWVFAGVAVGLFVGGLIGIVSAPTPPVYEDKETESKDEQK